MERRDRLDGRWIDEVETSDGKFELLGPSRLLQIRAQPGAFENAQFLMLGGVDSHEPLDRESAEVLGTDSGIAARFHFSRSLHTVYPFGITVVTVKAGITRRLLDGQQTQQLMDLVVRIQGSRLSDNWKGFVGLGRDDVEPAPYAFIAEKFVTARYPWISEETEEPSS
jgi:hypothetical protein